MDYLGNKKGQMACLFVLFPVLSAVNSAGLSRLAVVSSSAPPQAARPDPTHPLMYHCHLLRHEDDGMMGQFLLVEPGTESQVPTTLPKNDTEYQQHDHH